MSTSKCRWWTRSKIWSECWLLSFGSEVLFLLSGTLVSVDFVSSDVFVEDSAVVLTDVFIEDSVVVADLTIGLSEEGEVGGFTLSVAEDFVNGID